MRVLLVSNNLTLGKMLKDLLVSMDQAVDIIETQIEAKQVLQTEKFDLVIINHVLNELNGMELLKEYRKHDQSGGVMLVSAKHIFNMLVEALNSGADDCINGSVSIQELEARIRALLRRVNRVGSPVLKLGSIKLDTRSRLVYIDDNEVELTARERSLLEILLTFSGIVLSKEKIAHHLFSFNDEVNLTTIELYVHRLRKKISAPNISIRTIRGEGYVLSKSK